WSVEVAWSGEEGGGDEMMEMWCCDGSGMIRGDDVDGCGGVVFAAVAGGDGRKPTGGAPEK
ncbi:hypothetical protein Tco_0946480, partial [Tanacetum coccineum]